MQAAQARVSYSPSIMANLMSVRKNIYFCLKCLNNLSDLSLPSFHCVCVCVWGGGVGGGGGGQAAQAWVSYSPSLPVLGGGGGGRGQAAQAWVSYSPSLPVFRKLDNSI